MKKMMTRNQPDPPHLHGADRDLDQGPRPAGALARVHPHGEFALGLDPQCLDVEARPLLNVCASGRPSAALAMRHDRPQSTMPSVRASWRR